MATAQSANDLTRQQLDELDALLQRMLNLPNSPAEVPASNWRADPAGSATAAAPLHMVPLPRPEPLAAPVSKIPTAPVSPPEPALPLETRDSVVPATPSERKTAANANPAAPVSDYVPSVPAVLWPLAALNWTVDTLLGWCGPPGRFLRSGLGKNLLGLAGLLLLAYTTAHIASELGWLSLPAPLPWPR